MAKNGVETLEQGNIYFFYRPKIGHGEPHSEDEVQRMYIVLSPDRKESYRLAVIGKKELPQPGTSGRQKYWGYISKVSSDPNAIRNELGPEQYHTKTRGERQLETARPMGEGVYRIVLHDGHTHLVYALELPRKPGEVQDEFNIEDEASYVITVPNPHYPAPPRAKRRSREAQYPEKLKNQFRERRFSELNPPDFLDYEGAEFVLISASGNIKEDLGVELKTERETVTSADIFNDLHLDRSKRPTRPLFRGEWE